MSILSCCHKALAFAEYDTGRFAEAQMARLGILRMLVALAADVNGRYEQGHRWPQWSGQPCNNWGGAAHNLHLRRRSPLCLRNRLHDTRGNGRCLCRPNPDIWRIDARANQLAHYLQAQGWAKYTGSIVAGTFEMAVGLLGILKAGGVCAADPKYPTDRLQYMLADSEAALLLTQADLRVRLTMTKPVLCLDADWAAQVAALPTTPPASMATPQSLAYLIYVWLDGAAKGVMVPQRAG
ncbi:MAG: AMP-binding protein [Chloroflexota bacterium]